MPTLTRWRRLCRDDRGAVVTMVALLVAGGVLLGSLALVVDLGQIYIEREELQNGADSAALAVATACAAGVASCAEPARLAQVVQRYADLNAADAVSNVVEICGRAPGLAECGAEAAGLAGCVGMVPEAEQYVEIRLRTEMSDGQFALPGIFARSTNGAASTAVRACARASWRSSTELSIVAVSLSSCELAATVGREQDEYVVQLSREFTGPCGEPSGQWQAPLRSALLTGDASCQLVALGDGVLPGRYLPPDATAAVAPECETRLSQARDAAETIYLPVHDGVGPDTSLRLRLLVPVRITGYRLGPATSDGTHDAPSLSGVDPCDPDLRCLAVQFLGPPLPLSELVGGGLVSLIG